MMNDTETGVIKSGGNYYATVRGYVYHLRAFGVEDQAREFAAHLYSTPSFAPEFGWIPKARFHAKRQARATVTVEEVKALQDILRDSRGIGRERNAVEKRYFNERWPLVNSLLTKLEDQL